MLTRGRIINGVALAALLLLAFAPAAAAHVTKAAGPFQVSFGWGVEPPITGSANFVDVSVADSSGAPVAVPAGALQAEVSFGTARATLPLEPSDEAPGSLEAQLVPTRPGTYAFHITGRLKGQPIDLQAGCSQSTFDCVSAASDVEFPVKDPSTGEVAQALSREQGRAKDAADSADSARAIAVAAIVLAALALAAAIGLALRLRRKSG